MSLRIKQGFKYEGEDWWQWWVWVDGPTAELDQVKAVTYVLHPTFAKPVRRITDRGNNFRLETGGWGTFKIRAKAEMEDGEIQALEHELRLEYPDGTITNA